MLLYFSRTDSSGTWPLHGYGLLLLEPHITGAVRGLQRAAEAARRRALPDSTVLRIADPGLAMPTHCSDQGIRHTAFLLLLG